MQMEIKVVPPLYLKIATLLIELYHVCFALASFPSSVYLGYSVVHPVHYCWVGEGHCVMLMKTLSLTPGFSMGMC